MGQTCSGSLCFINEVMGRGAGTPAVVINQSDPASPSGPKSLAPASALPPVAWGVGPEALGSGVRSRARQGCRGQGRLCQCWREMWLRRRGDITTQE